MRPKRRTVLLDPRLLGLLAASIAASLVLSLTPLSGRAWLVLAWGVLVYAGTALWVQMRPFRTAAQPTPARLEPAPDRIPMAGELIRPTEEALRKLNNPAALGECALAGYLPGTLKAIAEVHADALHGNHHPLRTALLQAIERMKPVEVGATVEQVPYHGILHNEYVLGRSTARIMTQYSISESTFHRYRRDAIRALARDLALHEEALGPHAPVRQVAIRGDVEGGESDRERFGDDQ